MHELAVTCRPQEFAVFQPPTGQTCGEWANPFVNAAGVGYLDNPNATADCGYCQYRVGDDYYLPLDIKFSERGRSIGVMIGKFLVPLSLFAQ